MDKRRFFSTFYFVLLTCILILLCSKDVNGADWISFGTATDDTEYFYDKQSIIFLPNNSVRVFVKMVPQDEQSRMRAIASLRTIDPTIPDNYGYQTVLHEMNCKDRTSAGIQLMVYDKENGLINTRTFKQPSPMFISSDTVMEKLYKILCVKKDTTKKGRCEGVLCW